MRTLHPDDLAALIASDHTLATVLIERLERGEGERTALVAQLVFNLSVHAGAEESTVYPVVRARVPGGDALADVALAEHQALKEALDVLDREKAGAKADEALARVAAAVRQHVPEEETELLPALRAAVGDDNMLTLGGEFTAAKRKMPTHPHPSAPDQPPGNTLAGAVASLVDKVRDAGSETHRLVGTDASGRLDAQAQAVVDELASLGAKPIEILEPDDARAQPTPADAIKHLLERTHRSAAPEMVASVREYAIPGDAGQIRVRVYDPAPGGARQPVVIYVHGGGWVIADIDTYDASARALALRVPAMVVSIEYRHAPEHRFPAAHDDVLAATQWVMEHVAELGGDPARVAIAGESAGGNMAAATCLSLKRMGLRMPSCQLLVYPVTSTSTDWNSFRENADAQPLHSAMMGWFTKHLLASPAQAHDDRLALLEAPLEDLAGLPPALVITAERDPLLDQAEAFAERLRAAGVDVRAVRYPGVPHEFFGMAAAVDRAAQAQIAAARFLRGAFSSQAAASVR
jgi:acetyl esterase